MPQKSRMQVHRKAAGISQTAPGRLHVCAHFLPLTGRDRAESSPDIHRYRGNTVRHSNTGWGRWKNRNQKTGFKFLHGLECGLHSSKCQPLYVIQMLGGIIRNEIPVWWAKTGQNENNKTEELKKCHDGNRFKLNQCLYVQLWVNLCKRQLHQ